MNVFPAFRRQLPAILLVLPGLCSCSGFAFKGNLGVSQYKPTGNVALGASSTSTVLSQVKNDFQDSFGIDDSLTSPYARVEASAPIFSFTVSGFVLSDNAQGILDFDYGNLKQGAQIDTDMDIANLKGAVHFDILNLGPVRISPGVGVNLLDLDIQSKVTASGGSSSVVGETDELKSLAPVPMGFLQGEIDLGFVDLVVDAGYLDVDLEEFEGSMIDLEALIRWRPLENLEVFGGYRLLDIDAKGDLQGQDFDMNFSLSGWMLGVGIFF